MNIDSKKKKKEKKTIVIGRRKQRNLTEGILGSVQRKPNRFNRKFKTQGSRNVKMRKEHGEEIVKDLGCRIYEIKATKNQVSALFKAEIGHEAWTDINGRLVTPSYLGRADHIRKFNAEHTKRT
ncbi:hypothetical protein ANN_00098 [Periplaneta americana]|uniref:Uncharacterized protein n=1 Tax=Periplaneta americana TaxID=6978 RepID=A0ABQ8TQ09_PERAM|nr:hypothetical protein ANN_00098 [Periplaneta americana]